MFRDTLDHKLVGKEYTTETIGKIYKRNNIYTMARPIKETPVLVGKEAERLVAKIDNPRTVSASEVVAARHAYESMMSIAKFNF